VAAATWKFREVKLMERILPDIDDLLQVDSQAADEVSGYDDDPALPGPFWDAPDEGE
jgi:hypothetical protein